MKTHQWRKSDFVLYCYKIHYYLNPEKRPYASCICATKTVKAWGEHQIRGLNLEEIQDIYSIDNLWFADVWIIAAVKKCFISYSVLNKLGGVEVDIEFILMLHIYGIRKVKEKIFESSHGSWKWGDFFKKFNLSDYLDQYLVLENPPDLYTFL